jgi:hypothetical protein
MPRKQCPGVNAHQGTVEIDNEQVQMRQPVKVWCATIEQVLGPALLASA